MIDHAIGSEMESIDGREYPIGRDPLAMTQDELRAMGHEPMSLSAAIRAHCLDCCAGSAHEVGRSCIAPSIKLRSLTAKPSIG